MSECASVAGHFDGHAEALKRSTWHHPMQHVQGYKGSHWMLPSGDSSLRIALAATLVTINTPRMKNVTSLLAILMAIAMQWYYTARIA